MTGKKITLENLANKMDKGFKKAKKYQVVYRFEIEELDRRLKIVEAKLGLV